VSPVAASLGPAWRVALLADAGHPRRSGGEWTDGSQAFRDAIAGLSRTITRAGDAASPDDNALLTEFVDAARRAVSSDEALRLALATVRARLTRNPRWSSRTWPGRCIPVPQSRPQMAARLSRSRRAASC
jgi:hypothetical protein